MAKNIESNEKLKLNNKMITFIIVALIVFAISVILGIKVVDNSKERPETGLNNQTQLEEKTIPKDTTINMVAIGDIMCHKTNYKAAYDAKTKTYDFTPVFANVARYITKADIAIRKFGNHFCRRSKRI